ncbi:circadian clock protein KaiC [Halorhodospira abdelmalekii]|uniref:circadian clock protein KaiC n=1 Tax=Halorhodospira abdelmalekii TaxID=421629 RepID=UPI0019050FBD|nr:circadian clock protein KaiC [Halorhodospira abdelmalekii]MBK1734712.1 circadian clock protein KaiC [Halorhodospira abdelmalekii]
MAQTTQESSESPAPRLPAVGTGVRGLDFILEGGLPAGRPTLIRGGPGSGKTAIALTFLCYGLEQGEPGVLVTFDESPEALIAHAEGLGMPLRSHIAAGRAQVLDMRPNRSEVVAGQALELTAVLSRIGYALDRVGAQRLVVDAIDGMGDAFDVDLGLRSEIARVFDWLREQQTTTVITVGEQSDFSARYGLEDYIADCVILLRQEIKQRLMTRLLRVLKRRGGGHGTNEFPFLLDADGVFLAPVTGVDLRTETYTDRHSTGVPGLDAMLGGGGPYRGSAMMISGQSGTGKTSFAAAFACAVCDEGEHVLYLSFEESDAELVRNQRSVGLDLTRHLTPGGSGQLTLRPLLPAELGWEEHLLRIMRAVDELQPSVVIIDPISALADRRLEGQGKEMLLRLFYRLKKAGITVLATELLTDASAGVSSLDVSSIIDVWVKLRRDEGAERLRRLITVVKARGLPTADEVEVFCFTERGVTVGEQRSLPSREGP